MSKVAIITGGSSGIGRETAILFQSKGYIVYEFSRRHIPTHGIKHVSVDVSNKTSVINGVNSVLDAEGKIDVLVTNAGMGIAGAVEHTETIEMQKIFDVNVFGTVNCINAVIPAMRQNGGGKIVCISSVASVASIPFQTFYSMSKSAVNSLVLALRNELKPFNIKVCAVMPGDVKTGFTQARETSKIGSENYGSRISRSISQMEHDEQNGMSPIRIAKKVFSLAEKKNPKPLSSLGFVYKLICVLLKVLPTRLANAIVGMIYAK